MMRNSEDSWSFESVWDVILRFATDLLGSFQSQHTVYEELSDEDLVKQMNQGDDRAFEILYERYFDKIYAFVIRRVTHKQIAEDLTSDVFMKAFTHRQSFVWKTSWSAWIYRIATNRVTDYHRTKKPTDAFDETVHDRPSTLPSAPDEIDRDILGRKLEACLEQLNERERMAVTMKYYAQCENTEIAEALGVTPNNAGVILHRALAKCGTLYQTL
jgi:RNA polymerase sigma-70 factor (ECF subfamily)